jgi:deoxyadenosine/deoxycytidine kinase
LKPYKYIAIEGNIGAGKSTLATFLHKYFGGKLLMEQFEENASLKEFYKNPSFAINTEIQFVLDRSLQLSNFHKNEHDLIISDYIPQKSLIFARNNLSKKDFSLYEPIAKRLLLQHPQPDLIIYLNRTTAELLENIKNRGRDYELSMGEDYLEGIHSGYEKYLFEMCNCPIIEINAREIDLRKPSQLASAFQRIIGAEYASTRRKVDLKTLVNFSFSKEDV